MDPLLDTAPCGYVCVADDGHITMANLTFASMLGMPRKDAVGKHVDLVLSAASRIFYQTHVFPTLKLQSRVGEVYVSLRDAQDGEVPVLLNASRRAEGERMVSDWIVVPMRQRNQYENEILKARKEAEEAGRAKDEFLAVVSHELRSPLSAITGWAHLLSTGTLNAETQQRALRAIQQNAALQAKLVDDLLDFGRIATGKLHLELAPLRLDTVVAAAAEGILPTAQAKSIQLEVRLEAIESVVSGDPDRLRQVFWNILANAVKFTPKGGRVQVHLRADESAVEVAIRDSGKGIAPEFLPQLFDRFRQEDAAARREGGLGLGMAITRHLVELHGGSISAASEGPGRGSTFTVRLPRLLGKSSAGLAAPAAPPAEEALQGAPDLDGMEILILESDSDARESVRAILQAAGARVRVVESVRDAELSYQRSRPDVMVTDIEIERGEGLELVRRIRELEESSGARTPAIALTARTRHADRMQALAAGFQVQLIKPVEPTELLAAIANLRPFARSREAARSNAH